MIVCLWLFRYSLRWYRFFFYHAPHFLWAFVRTFFTIHISTNILFKAISAFFTIILKMFPASSHYPFPKPLSHFLGMCYSRTPLPGTKIYINFLLLPWPVFSMARASSSIPGQGQVPRLQVQPLIPVGMRAGSNKSMCLLMSMFFLLPLPLPPPFHSPNGKNILIPQWRKKCFSIAVPTNITNL